MPDLRQPRHDRGSLAVADDHRLGRVYARAATTAISTFQCGAARRASTQARPGVSPGDTQASHTAFMSLK